MSEKLKELQGQFDKNQAIIDFARMRLAASSRELDALKVADLLPENVERFAIDRRRLQDNLELLGQIFNYRQAVNDELQKRINELTVREARESVAKKNTRIVEILDRLPFLARTDPQRDDLEAELAELERS